MSGFHISGESEIHIAIAFEEAAGEVISKFAKAYFGKELSELNEEERLILDQFGISGCEEWILDNPST